MITYSFLTDTTDGAIESPELNDAEAVKEILSSRCGVQAIWRLALDHETRTLGRCIHVWTRKQG
jgi:hypothetical protein